MKIGFIDLFIDEWHANNYPAWFRESPLGSAFEMGLAWEEAPAAGRPLDVWCRETGMTPARSLAEVVEGSDALCVLAPSNPEAHERLSALALRSGKPVYVDKPFAPDRDAARRMLDLAAQHGTPLMSCSALRFAAELTRVRTEDFAKQRISMVATRGGGGNLPEYAIHQTEMIVALMGCGVRRLRRFGTGKAVQILIEYTDDRTASLIWHPDLAYGIPCIVGTDLSLVLDKLTDYFPNLITAILEFFQSGQSSIPAAEILEITALTAGVIQAAESGGAWVDLVAESSTSRK